MQRGPPWFMMYRESSEVISDGQPAMSKWGVMILMYRGHGRIFYKRSVIWALVIIIAAVVGAAFVAVNLSRTGNESPDPTAVPLAQPSPNNLLIYLVPSGDDSQSLSLVNTDLAAPALARAPLVFGVQSGDYLELRNHLWTPSSMTFSGSGFAGAWPDEDQARFVMQLNGPIKIGDYSSCVAIKINGEEVRWSCGVGFSKFEFVPGGYTVAMNFAAPVSMEYGDRVDVSFVLGASYDEGERTIPNLVYGGNISVRTSFLEIGGGSPSIPLTN